MTKSMTLKMSVAVLAVLAGMIPALAADGFKTKVLLYGDSNTYGFIPSVEMPGGRHPDGVRWADQVEAALGDDVEVIVSGLGGRTTDLDSGMAFGGIEFNGAKMLTTVLSTELPVDVVVIMLGTNDLLAMYERTPERIAEGAAKLVAQALEAPQMATAYTPPKVLLVAPPAVGPAALNPPMAEYFAGAIEKSQQFGGLYQAVAEKAGVEFLDAGAVVTIETADGIHLDADDHAALAAAMTEKLAVMLD